MRTAPNFSLENVILQYPSIPEYMMDQILLFYVFYAALQYDSLIFILNGRHV
jgi:hypothetical protein